MGGGLFFILNDVNEPVEETPIETPQEGNEDVETQKTNFDFTIIPIVWVTSTSYQTVNASSTHTNKPDKYASFDTEWRSEKDNSENFSVDSHTYYAARGYTASYDDTNYKNLKYLDYNYKHTFNYQACLKVTMYDTSAVDYGSDWRMMCCGASADSVSNSANQTYSLGSATVYLYNNSSNKHLVSSSHPGSSCHYYLGGTYYLVYRWKYKVTFSDSYSGFSKTVDSVAGLTYTIPTMTGTRTGYTFRGWTGSNLSVLASTTTMSASNSHVETWTAAWQANTYTVTFNANGGTISTGSYWTGSGTTATKSVTYASTYGTLPTPTWTGFNFDGWHTTNSQLSTTKTITSSTKVSTASNHTLYAHWTRDLTYDGNGYDSGTVPSAVTGNSWQGIITIATNNLQKAGFVANGWNTSSNYTATPTYSNGANYGASLPSITLYANFAPIAVNVTINAAFEDPLYGTTHDGSGWSADVSYYNTTLTGTTTQNVTTTISADSTFVMRSEQTISITNVTAPDGYLFRSDITPQSFWIEGTSGVTISLPFVRVSDNQLKYDSVDKYYYFEDGEFPQTAVVTYDSNFNTLLTNVCDYTDSFESNGITFYTHTYTYASGEDSSFSAYTGKRFLGFEMPTTRTVKLRNDSTTSRTFSAGTTYWFEYEPIRWRVSDYDPLLAPSDFEGYTSGKTNFVVASDVLWWDVLNDDSTNVVNQGEYNSQTTLMEKLGYNAFLGGDTMNLQYSTLSNTLTLQQWNSTSGNNKITDVSGAYWNEPLNMRYIRFPSNGSTANSYNHISKVKVKLIDGTELVLVDAPNSIFNSATSTPSGSGEGAYYGYSGHSFDLGEVRKVDAIYLRRYYPDGRSYYGQKIEYSPDGANWYVYWDSYNKGSYGNNDDTNLYAETAEGRWFQNGRAMLANQADIQVYQSDLRSYASQLVAVLAGKNQTEYFEYWTRDFGQQLGCGTYVTKSGTVLTNSYWNTLKGVRFSICMTEGSNAGV